MDMRPSGKVPDGAVLPAHVQGRTGDHSQWRMVRVVATWSRMCDCSAESSGRTCRPIGSTLRGMAVRQRPV